MYVYVKAVALSMSTAVQSLLLFFNLGVPSPCSRDTGLWSFKAISMALQQALNSIFTKKKDITQKTSIPNPAAPTPVTTPARSTVSQPPLGVKPAAWFSQASPISR